MHCCILKQDGDQERAYIEHTGVKQTKKRGKPPLGVQNQWKKHVKKGKHGARAEVDNEKHDVEQPDNPSSSNRASTHNGPGVCNGVRSANDCFKHVHSFPSKIRKNQNAKLT